MRPAQFRTRIFSDLYSRAASERALDRWLESLTLQDLDYLREHPDTPRLYDSGVHYFHEGVVDEYFDIPECLNETIADCKSLAAWLSAEYRFRGVDLGARCCKKFAVIEDPDAGTLLLYHIQVQRSDGSIEDPSAVLGMNKDDVDGYIPVPGVPWTVANGMTNVVGAAILGNEIALGQLDALRKRAENGDARARYLVEVARIIRGKGYDPQRTRWTRLPDASWAWTKPGEGQ
jgi:hypothetical protein